MRKRGRKIRGKQLRYFAGAVSVAVLGLVLVMTGCGDDGTGTGGGGTPDISLAGGCVSGVPGITITNNAGDMEAPGMFRVLYEDAAIDSGSFQLGEGGFETFGLSNMHGIAQVNIDGTTQSELIDNCLQALLQSVLDTMSLDGLVPSPLTETDVSFCHYTIDIENFQHGPPAVEMQPVSGGMHLRVVYSNITADIIMDTESPMCVDATGSLTMASIVLEADMIFDVQPDRSVEVTLANLDTTINDLDIQIDGVLGFLVNWLVDYFEGDFSQGLEEVFSLIFEYTVAPMLEGILVPI